MKSGQGSSLAILGGMPVRDGSKPWPKWPVFDDVERRALNAVLDSGQWWFGKEIAAFEAAFAQHQDTKYCISCSNGTVACEIAVEALGIRDRDADVPPFEVLVPPYTFIATAGSVARMGGLPVFVDVDESWCMNPDLIEASITPRTKAIMPVHFGGRVCDMDRLNAIADAHGLAVIEDACHSWGGKFNNKGTGGLGLGGVFSFQMSKNITAGEGGAIVTDDEGFANTCRSIVNCGRGGDGVWYGHVRIGTNARLTEFQGALLRAQLTRLEEQTIRREANAAILNRGLAQIEGLTVQPGDERITRRAYHLYCMRIESEKFGCTRDQFLAAAEAEGLPIGGGYGMPVYKQKAFSEGPLARHYHDIFCPVAEDLCDRTGMWFEHQLLLGDEHDMGNIVTICAKIKENASALRDAAQKQGYD